MSGGGAAAPPYHEMKPIVHILVTIRNPALRDAALLVFKTLRVGFPTSDVKVWGNGLKAQDCAMMELVCQQVGAQFLNVSECTHGAWIESLVMNSPGPIWICDTDIVFFDSVEDKLIEAPLFAGRFEPEFIEPWTKTLHVARLHPSLCWLDAPKLREALWAWPGADSFFCSVKRNFFEWEFVPVRGADGRCGTHFYDTLAGLHQAFGGTPFDDALNDCYEHLFCGTYSDLIEPFMGLKDFGAQQRAICADPKLARGMQVAQREFYKQHAQKGK